MVLSAVAARLAAEQQKAEQAIETIPTACSSVCTSPISSSSETTNHQPCPVDEIEVIKDKKSHSLGHQSTDQIIPEAITPALNPSQEINPARNLKRRRDSTRSSFIDHQCVSNWEPVYEGPHQNVSKIVDPNNHHPTVWTLGLRTAQTLITHGTLQLTILRGAVDLMGSELIAPSSQPIQVFAPPSHPLPIITAKDVTKDIESRSSGIQVPHLDITQFSAIVQLKDFHCGIQQLDELWTSNGNKAPIWSRSSCLHHPIQGRTWSLLLSLTPNLAHLQVPPSWSSSLLGIATAESACIYMIEGPKGTGKSTFSTMLINSLLNTYQTVALLDLDPGQPLLTPPTLLSLHMLNSPILGPSFCRLVAPHHSDSHSIYIGHTTPKDYPNRYMQASLELFNFYLNLQPEPQRTSSKNKQRRYRYTVQSINSADSKRVNQVPLVINTMGWTRGLGQELLNQICELIQPNKIFSFSDHQVITNLSEALERHIKLEPIGSTALSLRLTPTDCRVLTIVSYMHSNCGSGKFFVDQWDFQHPLYTRRPFEIKPDRLSLPDHPGFDRDHLGHAVNGGLIGFINSSSGWWIGFGLVRAINPNQNTIHLLTPAYPTPEQDKIQFEFVKYSEPEVPVICCIGDGLVPYIEKETLGGPATSSNGINSNNFAARLGKKRIRRNVQRRSQISR